MKAEEALAVAIAVAKKVGVGIKDHSVEGLTLTVVFQDDTTEEITFEEPSAADVAGEIIERLSFSVDSTTGHLIMTIDGVDTDIGNVKGDKGDSPVVSVDGKKVTFGI